MLVMKIRPSLIYEIQASESSRRNLPINSRHCVNMKARPPLSGR